MHRRFVWVCLGISLATVSSSLLLGAQEREGRSGDNTAKKYSDAAPAGDKDAPGKVEIIFRVDGKLTAANPKDKEGKGRYFQVHKVKLEAGNSYSIVLGSTEFDAYLRLEDGDDKKLAEDDDGAGGTNSRIVFPAAKSDVYAIIVTSFDAGATGKFTLTVRQVDKVAAEWLVMEAEARKLNATGIRNLQRGDFPKAFESFREGLSIRQRLFPKDRFPVGHGDLADSLNNLGAVLEATGDYAQAELYFRQALVMRQQLYPKDRNPQGHPDLAQSLNNTGGLLKAQGEYDKAERYYHQALKMRQELYPKDCYPQGHRDVAESLNNMGSLLQAKGEYAKAEPYYRQSLAMLQELYPKARHPQGHAHLAGSLDNLGSLLRTQGEYAKAERYILQALAMNQELYPKARYPEGHQNLAGSLNNLGILLWAQGEFAKAEPYFRQALAMRQQLYPKDRYPHGHADLATSLNNIGSLLRAQGESAKAEPYYRQALAMKLEAYPKARYSQGHPSLVSSFNNLGSLLMDQGEYAKAEPYYHQALAMNHQLYPKARFPRGHPQLAVSFNNLGFLLQDQGEYAKAEPYFRKALAMNMELYPKAHYPEGHPLLAISFGNLGVLLQYQGKYAQAEEPQTLAVLMAQQLSARHADLASAAEAISYLAKDDRTEIPHFLSVVRRRDHRAADYGILWTSRSMVTRVVERRHQNVLATKDDAARQISERLTQVRQRLAHLLFKGEIKDADAHGKEVEDLAGKKEKLEKELALALRLDPPPVNTDEITPARLQEALNAGCAFIDMLRYLDFEPNPKLPGRKGEKITPRYLAYIVTRGEILRVDLKEARPLEKAWSAWREAIVNNAPSERETASRFADLVWGPIAKQLPSDVKTIYLAPDGLLTQVPWAALPGSKPGNVLLEELTIATVPHGPYLLQRLTAPARTSERGGILVVGGVDYDEPPIKIAALEEGQRGPLVGKVVWLALPGTKKELKQVAELATKVKLKPVERSAIDASTDQVLVDLGNVRYAHLATHGFFADAKFRSALQVDPKLFETLGQRSKVAGARSPLVLSGLVFAGANRQGEKAAPDRGILTAEAIVGQRLEGMDIAVLSACETGLGEVGGGEGVYGLARAFHVAGCKNVIASLWKVDDEPTAALMGMFYRNLWIEKKSPVESLRQAQLHLYHHPEQIPVLAKLRGIDFAERTLPKVTATPAAGKRAPTSQWAAFLLSGTGN